ncbi:MAG: tRNA dihydrouridine(20/20a) synthase DusA [Leptospiraceae bacterium]|nr:tRNA dihydrouridine(20/20a) synthase DusA [Leptospiraceae bacterium]MCP5503120.1 tRNA dihydrouridine(20/20a) synthase DusA [Leptospiraceae bacterium]
MQSIPVLTQPLSIAPMMDWTDRYYRYLMRLITRKTLLYTEMVTTPALLHGNRKNFLQFNKFEKPLVLQLGGDNPSELMFAARLAEEWGYSGINLNVGCPSDRVQNGNFGACLMANPHLVGECLLSMQNVVKIPVSIKHRIGIDGYETYQDLQNFVSLVSSYGCKHFIIHARVAILKGLSPLENRTIPPLRYEDVYKIKKEFPDLQIDINGGIRDFTTAKKQLKFVDSVMIGREAYENPFLFEKADSTFFGEEYKPKKRKQILEELSFYLQEEVGKGQKPSAILRHCLNLYKGVSGSKQYKRFLTENMYKNQGIEFFKDLLKELPEEI